MTEEFKINPELSTGTNYGNLNDHEIGKKRGVTNPFSTQKRHDVVTNIQKTQSSLARDDNPELPKYIEAINLMLEHAAEFQAQGGQIPDEYLRNTQTDDQRILSDSGQLKNFPVMKIVTVDSGKHILMVEQNGKLIPAPPELVMEFSNNIEQSLAELQLAIKQEKNDPTMQQLLEEMDKMNDVLLYIAQNNSEVYKSEGADVKGLSEAKRTLAMDTKGLRPQKRSPAILGNAVGDTSNPSPVGIGGYAKDTGDLTLNMPDWFDGIVNYFTENEYLAKKHTGILLLMSSGILGVAFAKHNALLATAAAAGLAYWGSTQYESAIDSKKNTSWKLTSP